MKTTFDEATRTELIDRISHLNENTAALWGKMNVFQMVKHCCVFEQMIAGKTKYRQAFIGKIFGRMALKSMLGKGKPMGKNSPTAKEFIITETTCDLSAAKQDWITMLQSHATFHNPDFIHPFFGKMSREQIGQLAYLHYDHHLRQFGV